MAFRVGFSRSFSGWVYFRSVRSFLVCFTWLIISPFVLAIASPRIAEARSGPHGAGAHPGRVKTSRVLIENDGPEIVLEAKARDGVADGSPDLGDGAVAPGAREDEGGDPDGATAGVVLPLDAEKWDTVCSSPCGRDLPRAALFRVTGSGITASAAFNLPSHRPEVTLRVRAGDSRWYWTGVILACAGGSFVLGGAGPPLLLGGSFSTTEKILGGTGILLLATGLPLWIINRTTVAIF
jgi:hypothetical protein